MCDENKFCKLGNLRNESDVEQFLVAPLLEDLGYGADYVETKTTITEASIGKAKSRKRYVPDYLAYTSRSKVKPVLIIDAKHPSESAEEGVRDAQLYASVIRRKMASPKSEPYCMGTNGNRVIVKNFDSDEVLHSLTFFELVDENPTYQALRAEISRDSLSVILPLKQANGFEFRSVKPVELPAILEVCHRSIWKAEKRSPASAFYEFAQIMFVKVDEDRRLREYLSSNDIDARYDANTVPTDAVRFSVHWIEQMEKSTDNPIDTILFSQLTNRLEEQIEDGLKKRIFERGEGIGLSPATVKDVVSSLEHFDLYTVDEDLNGRLFETFLTATMRGKELGQFFTPRSVVKFMVRLAKLRATRLEMDRVLDGCCGTGGFLIEAMADMTNKVVNNRSITDSEKESLLQHLRQEALWGIDAGKDPEMARIARLNMLLHKDGGSRIYFADALDKKLRIEKGLPLSVRTETKELRSEIMSGNMTFSCILSNPPFSMKYERKKKGELEVLKHYDLATDVNGKPRASLRSSVMFIERYHDLLTDSNSAYGAGRLITVMDESILNTLTSKPFREYILENFILRAVVSLPRNTFVKAQGSVKTSAIYLRKKIRRSESQASVLMAICPNVGHTDSGKERPHLNVLPDVLKAFEHFDSTGSLQNVPTDAAFLVSDLFSNNPTLRLDAQYFSPQYFDSMKSLDEVATQRDWTIQPLEKLLRDSRTALTGGATPRGAEYPDDGPKFVRVQNVKPLQLEWNPEDDPCISSRTHVNLLRSQLRESDVVFTITGSFGVAAVVPEGFPPANINQHSVKIEVNDQIMPEYLALFLNSSLCRPQLVRAATGSSRPALDYEAIKQFRILYPPDKTIQMALVNDAFEKLARSETLRKEAKEISNTLADILN